MRRSLGASRVAGGSLCCALAAASLGGAIAAAVCWTGRWPAAAGCCSPQPSCGASPDVFRWPSAMCLRAYGRRKGCGKRQNRVKILPYHKFLLPLPWQSVPNSKTATINDKVRMYLLPPLFNAAVRGRTSIMNIYKNLMITI